MTKILQKKLLFTALCFLWATIMWGQVSIPTQGTAVVTNFSGWNNTLPSGFSKSGSGANYVGTTASTTGGVYAVSGSGFGYRPSGNASALQLLSNYQNNTGATITQLEVSYDAFRIAHADSRLPGWAVTYNGTAVSQLGWAYDITKTAASPAVLTYTMDVNIPAGDTFSLAFNSDRGSGGGSSPLIGLNNISVKAIQPVPAAPVATAATTLTAAGFTANWNSVTGATSYELDVSADPAFGTMLPEYDSLVVTGISQYVVTGIQPGTTYYYRVRADNGTFISTDSNVIQVAVPCGVVALPATAAIQAFCGAATVSQLAAMPAAGGTINWYGAAEGGLPIAGTTALVSATYYVSQTINGCESTRIAVTVTINEIPVAPTAAAQAFCGAATVNNLEANGTAIAWYAAETGGTALEATAAVTTGTYYASQTVNGCESLRVSVIVTVNEIPVAPTAAAQAFCGATTASSLEANGAAISWYTSETGGTALEATDVVTTGTYYASQTINSCESARTAVAITVNEIPAAPVAVAQAFCGSGTVSQLAITTGTAVKWFSNETGGTELAGTDVLATGTYYVSQTINGCESARTLVVITVNEIPAAPTAAAQAFCGSATISQLEATATDAQWYAAETGGTALTGADALATGIYYVSQTLNGCESARTAVEVTVNQIPAAPTAEAQTFCSAATVEELEAEGVNIQWYATETGGESLEATAALITGTYYASQTANGCESPRAVVVVTLTTAVVPVGAANQDFEEGSGDSLADLDVTGTNVVWYADTTLTTELPAETELEDNTTYYAVSVVGECVSPALAVTVHEVMGTGVVQLNNIVAYPNPVSNTLYFEGVAEVMVVEVYNMVGQSVLLMKPKAAHFMVDMANLAAGNYIVNAYTEFGVKTIKVVKE